MSSPDNALPRKAATWSWRFSLLAGGTLVAAVSSFLLQSLAARHYSTTDYATIVVCLAVSNLLQPVSNLSLPWLLAQNRDWASAKRMLRQSATALLLSNLAALSASAIYIYVFGARSSQVPLLFALGALPMLLGQASLEVTSVRYQLEGRYAAFASSQAATQVARLAALAALVVLGLASAENAILTFALIGVTSALFSLVASARTTAAETQGLDLQPDLTRAVVTKAAPYIAMTLLSVGLGQAGILMLGWSASAREVAAFNVAMLLVTSTFMLPNVVYAKLLLPLIARWAHAEDEKFQASLTIGLLAFGVIGAAVTLTWELLARLLVHLAAGPRLAEAVPTLQILSLAILFRYLTSPIAAVLALSVTMRQKLKYHLLAGAFFLVICWLVSPVFGARGAATAFTGAEAILMACHFWGLRRAHPRMRAWAWMSPTSVAESLRRLAA